MSVNYALFRNYLTGEDNLYSAQVRIKSSADLDAIADRIIGKGSTTAKADLLAVLEDTVSAIESLLLEGSRINLGGMVSLYPRIKGRFIGRNDGYDPSRHNLTVGASAGRRLLNVMKTSGSVQKLNINVPTPILLEYFDVGSGTTNDVITPGRMGVLRGDRLKMNPLLVDEGLFLINTADGNIIEITDFARNQSAELTFQLPGTVPVGTYQMAVRTRINGGGNTREGFLENDLTVA